MLPEIAVDVDDPTVEWGLRIALLAEAAIASPLPVGTEPFRHTGSAKNCCNKFKFHSCIKLLFYAQIKINTYFFFIYI